MEFGQFASQFSFSPHVHGNDHKLKKTLKAPVQ